MQESLARLEGGFDQMNERMKHLEDDLIGLRNGLGNEISQLRVELIGLRNELKGDISQFREELRGNFRWTIGILLSTLIPMWVTLTMAILVKG